MDDCLRRAADIEEQLQKAEKKIRYYPSLSKSFDFLQRNLSIKITITRAAEEAAMSSSAFSRAFKGATGFSFHQFLILQGLRRAIKAIEASDESLTIIAIQAGFENLWSLEYNFKRHIGCEPSEYREAFLSTL